MQIKTCVHALLHSKKLYHINLMNTNLSLFHHSFIGGTLPEVNDYATSTNFLTLAGQLVNIINNANINNVPQLTLASGEIKGDCIGCLQNYATVNFDNPSVSNLASQYEWDISFYVTADYNVGGGGGGSSIDYTNILTNINTNLAALVSKNNQSEITQKLKEIFQYTYSDGSLGSCMKASSDTATSNSHKSNANIPTLLLKLIDCFYYQNISYEGSLTPSNKPIPKLINIPSILFDANFENLSGNNVPFLKEIALAISSLASANDNQAIKALKDTISALELKVNVDNALLVDGTQEFRMRPFGKNYIDDEDESYS